MRCNKAGRLGADGYNRKGETLYTFDVFQHPIPQLPVSAPKYRCSVTLLIVKDLSFICFLVIFEKYPQPHNL